MKLTEKQKRFVDYYVETGNLAEAAKKAGYRSKNPRNIGAENYAKPYIRDAIDARLKELESKRIASADEVLQFLTSTMRGELEDENIVVEGVGNGISEARTIETRVSARDRIEAAKSLLKRYPMDRDKEEQKLRLKKLEQDLRTADEAENDAVTIVDDLEAAGDEDSQTE